MDAVAGNGQPVGRWSVRKKDFGQAEGGRLVEAFLNCETAVTPNGKSMDDTLGEHDDESVAARSRFQANMDGADLELHSLAVAKGPLDKGEILIAIMDDFFGSCGLRKISFKT